MPPLRRRTLRTISAPFPGPVFWLLTLHVGIQIDGIEQEDQVVHGRVLGPSNGVAAVLKPVRGQNPARGGQQAQSGVSAQIVRPATSYASVASIQTLPPKNDDLPF